LRKSSWKT